MSSVKERLIEFLSYKKISQKKFAEQVGVSAGYVNAIRVSIQPKTIEKIAAAYPELNTAWLLTGEGPMLAASEFEEAGEPAAVPLYSLSAVARMAEVGEQEELIMEKIAWHGAQRGDFAVRVIGASMEPRIPNGSLLLLRPYGFTDWRLLEFGKVHAIVTEEGAPYVKTLRAEGDRLLLHSENPDFPDLRLSPAEVRRVYLAVAVQHPL